MEAFGQSLLRYLFFLLIGRVTVTTSTGCVSRRCLAQTLINLNLTSLPQSSNCTLLVYLPVITYETVVIETKDLRFTSRLTISLLWNDPGLSWNTSVYPYDAVVLPVKKVWTPGLSVDNAISTETRNGAKDLLVYSNGTVDHTLVMTTSVSCVVNLFRFPYASDTCPIALNAWNQNGCGLRLLFGTVQLSGSSRGDWSTNSVTIKGSGERNYLLVSISLQPFSPFVTLLFPSFLIILADLVSVALPLGSGGRIQFKITLVLSFIMFLLILSNTLPGDGPCSPLIRYHYCVCLIMMVMSLLISMVLTRVAKDGTILPFNLARLLKPHKGSSRIDGELKESQNEDPGAALSTINPKQAGQENAALWRVVSILEDVVKQEKQTQAKLSFANALDKVVFGFHLLLFVVYSVCITYLFVYQQCTIQHFDFWH